jgi:hypothetical protein
MPDHQATIGLVLDRADPNALARFWAVAHDYVVAGQASSSVALVPNDRPGPSCCSNASPKPRL